MLDSIQANPQLPDKLAPKAGTKLLISPRLLKSMPSIYLALVAFLFLSLAARSQQPAQTSSDAAQSEQPVTPVAVETGGGITEDELKQMLVGKPLFLRGCHLSDSLSYSQHGAMTGNSAPASYTLCAIEIERVRIGKKKVELVGARYGLHFLGSLPYEDPSKAVDRVKITPKKKSVKISIDREVVVKPKKVKTPKAGKKSSKHAKGDDLADAPEAESVPGPPAENKPIDPNAQTTTTSPAHSETVLRGALDRIFASSIDERMVAAMPDFWKFYYQAAAAKVDYRPADPAVMRQNQVDQKAKLLSKFEPSSNQFAQDYGVAGMCLYHVVIGPDGKPGEIAVARPIGFGLDENAVLAIRNAKFEPAIKDGKPVPVLLDLVVQFRIYSKRTAVSRPKSASDKPSAPILPGPYSVQRKP
jgi:outer membrane biosynthesis protein TonB